MKNLCFLLAALCLPILSFSQTLPPPFTTCPSTGFQVVDNPSKFQTVNLATGTTTTVANYPIYVNAMGFNANDNRIYGLKLPNPIGLVSIGSDYSYNLIATTGASLPNAVVGDVSPAGILWCLGSGTNGKVFTVDCNPASSSFGLVTIKTEKLTASITDWSFPTNDNTRIYTVTNNGSLIYIKTSDLSVTTVMPDNTLPPDGYGATYFDSNGNFYAKGNASGTIYKFINATTSSPTVIAFSSSSAANQNDGARCANAAAPIIADFGDAPDTYGTAVSSNGPSHLLPTPDASLAEIYFGAAVSIDADGQPSPAADLDIDDGVSSFTAIVGGVNPPLISAYNVTISVHNSTALSANVAGWIDWNNNGSFDAGEKIATTVAPGFIGTVLLTWLNVSPTGPNGTTGTYARFRISTDLLNSPLGAVSNGEVEDYYIPFTSPLPVNISSFTAVKFNNASYLVWSTASEHNNKGFSVERSTDGTHFSEISFVPTQSTSGNSTQKLVYQYYDRQPDKGINYYRLKQIDHDNNSQYSASAKVVFGENGNYILVYPNPAKDKLTIEGLNGNERIYLYNNNGQLLKQEKANSSIKILLINDLPIGLYRLVIIDASENRIIEKIIKE